MGIQGVLGTNGWGAAADNTDRYVLLLDTRYLICQLILQTTGCILFIHVFLDQCNAMEIAINAIMPGITHLWCKWHVFKDARIELGPLYRKNAAFQDEFHKVITEMYTVDEFENAWGQMVEKYGLKDHHYMVKAYDKRKKWAKAYNKGKFCARMTSTQRSESANHMLKGVVPRNSSMNRFVEI